MKHVSAKLSSLLCLLFLTTASLHADHRIDLGATLGNSLNDLLGRVNYLPAPPQQDLIVLSQLQEALVLYEDRMNGEGLPPVLEAAFRVNYGAIKSALIDDRISEDYGRDLLSVHRQLLERTHLWQRERNPNPEFGKQVIQNLHHFVSELEDRALQPSEVSPSLKTPILNGYQIWLGELIAWSCNCNGLQAGLVSRLRVQQRNLEYFEHLYKRDGVLYPNEREHLHKQFLKVTDETYRIIQRSF